MAEETMDTKEAARHLGLSTQRIDQLIRSGVLSIETPEGGHLRGSPRRVLTTSVRALAEQRRASGNGHGDDAGDYISTNDAAARLGVDRSWVGRMVRDGKLVGKRDDHNDWLITVASLDAYRRDHAPKAKSRVRTQKVRQMRERQAKPIQAAPVAAHDDGLVTRLARIKATLAQLAQQIDDITRLLQ
jgi:hypothetical protein